MKREQRIEELLVMEQPFRLCGNRQINLTPNPEYTLQAIPGVDSQAELDDNKI